MAQVVIFGTSEIAEIVHYYLKHDSEHEVVGFTVDEAYLQAESFNGLPLVPYEKLEKYYPPSEYKLFIAISYKNVNKLRAEKYFNAKKRGYSCISYISSKASYHGTQLGENSFILEHSIIQPFSSIGNNCLLLGANHIGHHCTIEDHCFLTSDVVIGGGATIGEYTFIGLNATIRNYINIGKENIIGAGAIVLSHTEDRAVYSPGETAKFDVPSNFIRI
ncbi:MAG: acetyltransferase [Aulosira sp. ZfuVER01]|nr:acetyltransferase [Aulosira sp. ZfuVER01]MDZ7998047.1 acetyltransferase [Aulosira sp. DedVER01a]MDZ8050441.1 acetyltransferase [Aulosira sp. ZfuCHP01]